MFAGRGLDGGVLLVLVRQAKGVCEVAFGSLFTPCFCPGPAMSMYMYTCMGCGRLVLPWLHLWLTVDTDLMLS